MIKILLSFLLVFGCVFAEQMQEKSEFDDEFAQPNEIFDPLGGYNRMMTGFNDFIYTKAIHSAIIHLTVNLRFLSSSFFAMPRRSCSSSGMPLAYSS